MGGYSHKCKELVKSSLARRHLRHKYEERNEEVREYLEKVPMPELTAQDKAQIDEYWSQFGVRIRNYDWFRWFYGVSGIKSPKYIPNDLWFDVVLTYYYTDRAYLRILGNKNMFDLYLPDVPFPPVVFKRLEREFCGPDGQHIPDGDRDALIGLLLSAGEVIVKRTRDTSQGKSVKKYSIHTREDAEAVLREWDVNNYIVQKVVRQHPFLARFNESSVNIMRVTTWYHDGVVDILNPNIRIGTPGYVTDIAFIDGDEKLRSIGITENGYLMDKIVSINEAPRKVDCANERVPGWDKVVRLVKESAPKLKGGDIIGWDITVDEQEEPVVIEYNIGWPAVMIAQMVGGPLPNTDRLLAFLKDEKNQKKYLQSWWRK